MTTEEAFEIFSERNTTLKFERLDSGMNTVTCTYDDDGVEFGKCAEEVPCGHLVVILQMFARSIQIEKLSRNRLT